MAYGFNSQGQVIYYPDTDSAPGGNALPTSQITGSWVDPTKLNPDNPLDYLGLRQGGSGTSGPVWNLIRGKLPPGKKYDSNGNIVNTTAFEKFDTGFGNAMKWGGIGLGVAAGGALAGGALAGAYGGGALAAAPAASSGAGTLGAASTIPTAIGSTAIPATLTGSGAGLGAGFGGAAFGAAPTLASSSIGGLGVGSTSVPATVTGSGPFAGVGGGGTGSTLGQTLVKKGEQQLVKTAANKTAKKVMKAGAVVAPAVAGLYAATRGKGGGSMDFNQALTALLQQQQAQMQEESPLRKLLLSQQAGMLPSYMKRDPQYQQWLQNSAGGVQSAMNATARPRFA